MLLDTYNASGIVGCSGQNRQDYYFYEAYNIPRKRILKIKLIPSYFQILYLKFIYPVKFICKPQVNIPSTLMSVVRRAESNEELELRKLHMSC